MITQSDINRSSPRTYNCRAMTGARRAPTCILCRDDVNSHQQNFRGMPLWRRSYWETEGRRKGEAGKIARDALSNAHQRRGRNYRPAIQNEQRRSNRAPQSRHSHTLMANVQTRPRQQAEASSPYFGKQFYLTMSPLTNSWDERSSRRHAFVGMPARMASSSRQRIRRNVAMPKSDEPSFSFTRSAIAP
ncbi:hypothetical protein SAMN04515620_102132 [Collimonas sp. OK607]|nr:hypothetical protein SAMN04515620_102132 [Collimonas sp. OK607]